MRSLRLSYVEVALALSSSSNVFAENPNNAFRNPDSSYMERLINTNFNGDQKIDAGDLTYALMNWGQESPDLDGDGTCGVLEVTSVFDLWKEHYVKSASDNRYYVADEGNNAFFVNSPFTGGIRLYAKSETNGWQCVDQIE